MSVAEGSCDVSVHRVRTPAYRVRTGPTHEIDVKEGRPFVAERIVLAG